MDPVGAEYIGDLVGVGDNRGRAEGQHQPCELSDEELRGLDVHVRVDEPRHHETPFGVDHLRGAVIAQPRHEAVDDRDVGLEPLAREHRQHGSALNDEVGRLVAPGDGDAPREVSHGADHNRQGWEFLPSRRITGC